MSRYAEDRVVDPTPAEVLDRRIEFKEKMILPVLPTLALVAGLAAVASMPVGVGWSGAFRAACGLYLIQNARKLIRQMARLRREVEELKAERTVAVLVGETRGHRGRIKPGTATIYK